MSVVSVLTTKTNLIIQAILIKEMPTRFFTFFFELQDTLPAPLLCGCGGGAGCGAAGRKWRMGREGRGGRDEAGIEHCFTTPGASK